MLFYHPEGVSSTIIDDINTKFSRGIEYKADDGSVITIKDVTYNVSYFSFSNNSLNITTTSGQSVTIIQDNHIANANLIVSSIPASVKFDYALPLTSESMIGSSANPYGNIYSEAAEIGGIRIDSGSSLVIYTEHVDGPVNDYGNTYKQHVRLYNDRYVEIIYDVTLEEKGLGIDYNINNTKLLFECFNINLTERGYGSPYYLSLTKEMTDEVAVLKDDSTDLTVYGSVSVTGYITEKTFSDILASIGE